MNLNTAMAAPAIKRVARTVNELIRKEASLEDRIAKINEKYEAMREAQIAKLMKELEQTKLQQDLFEKPIIEMTGYRTTDLVDVETTDSGQTRYVLRYPKTIVPVDASVEDITPETVPVEQIKDLFGYTSDEPEEKDEEYKYSADDLPM